MTDLLEITIKVDDWQEPFEQRLVACFIPYHAVDHITIDGYGQVIIQTKQKTFYPTQTLIELNTQLASFKKEPPPCN